MKKKVYKFFLLFLVILISIFSGYENPNLVEVPKKYARFIIKKMGIKDSFFNKKIENIDPDKNEKKEERFSEFNGNSFSLYLSKVKSYSGKSASLIIKNNNNKIDYEIFTQKGLLIKDNKISEINLPLSFYTDKDGGVKSVFIIKNKYFALLSLKKFGCIYASLINLKKKEELMKTDCIPDEDGINLGGLGGAFIKDKKGILLTIGAPTHISEEIDMLAQKSNSPFGKILFIKNEEFLDNSKTEIKYDIFSKGHKNPQGLTFLDDTIFSLEHGPQGGDELNKIVKGKNFGWPIASLGTRYNDGKSYLKSHIDNNFEEPIFTFSPAVAPSSLSVCPDNLKRYYKNYNCLMGLSLRGMSILIFLLDKKKSKVIGVEKIFLEKRLRHFGLSPEGNTFFDKENNFYITSDNDGMYKIKFNKFR
tara:strand:- start:193 stop:1449 length:1257 start_codon:yes stop_codon:yes gene_type:complete